MTRTVLVICLLLLAVPAHAQDYIPADWPSLAKTLVRFGAIKLSDDKALDEYAAITECDLYRQFYRDDFKWNQVRAAIRDDVRQHVATFPTAYRYDAELQLDRYDFNNNLFRFTEKSVLRNVNTFKLYSVEGSPCVKADLTIIPRAYRVVLDTPFSLDGLPLAPKDGEALLQQMKDNHNDSRIVWARFNLHVVYIEPLYENARAPGGLEARQKMKLDSDGLRLDSRLDSVDFSSDPGRTKLIYHLEP